MKDEKGNKKIIIDPEKLLQRVVASWGQCAKVCESLPSECPTAAAEATTTKQ